MARCTVARLMAVMGLAGVLRGKKVRTTVSRKTVAAGDRVNRQFVAERPDQLWVAGFTYVSTWQGFVYVAFIIDVFAGYIVGWRVSSSMETTFVLDALEQWATKQWPQFSGVVALTAENRNRILKLLGLQPVGEVWGVGRRLTEKLNALGINTALQLAQANTAFIRKNFSVILERTVRELNGESCISLEEAPPAKQQIVCSRSFGERITDKDAMHQAVVQYAERAAEKLRGERQYCRQVTTFVRTSPFAVKEPCYSNAAVEKLSLPTQDSRDIIAAACRALNHVWREGYRYMKAGVMLADFTPSGIAQPGLFDEIQPRKNSEKLMKTLDELNQSGKGKVWFAGRGTAPEWQMKQEMLSPSYTTQ